VETDNAGGMTALTEHLVQSHDFARFAFLTGPDHSPDAAARLVSWNETLERHGIPEERRIVYPGDLSYGSGQALAARFGSESRPPFDVLSCANDDMALGFIQTMGRQGFSCPRDYAVTGFDDIQEAGFLSPLLTTVHQPLYEQAYTAGLRLLQQLGLSGLPVAPDDSLAGCTRVILALHRPNPKNPETDEEDGFYDDVELVPCLDTPGGTDSVRMPLLGITQSYGYIILEGTALDALVFESLRDQVSQTLESIARTKDRERVEQALRDSEERYREMAAAVPVMVLETDTLLRIEYRNAAAASGLVIPDDAALKSLKTYLEPEDASLAEDAVQRVRETRELNSPGIRLVSPDRRRYIPVVKISGKFDQKGNLVRIRWDALDPLPFLNSGILPDKEFFTAHKITGREQEIVELQLQGYRIRDIAEKLFIAESTVKGHLTQVYNKLGITGKGELLRMLRDEQVGRFGFSAYVFSLVNSLLSPDEN
jgi:DNA-binding CsgD family transcriptional regulator